MQWDTKKGSFPLRQMTFLDLKCTVSVQILGNCYLPAIKPREIFNFQYTQWLIVRLMAWINIVGILPSLGIWEWWNIKKHHLEGWVFLLLCSFVLCWRLELVSIYCVSEAISDLKLKCLLCCVTRMVLCLHSLTLPMVWPRCKFRMARLWNACTSTTETVCRTPSMYLKERAAHALLIIYLVLCHC